jgi:DNA-binding Xre family transcriptional regulator
MISYEPLWRTLNEKDMSTYDLIYRHGLSANTIHRMKSGKPITTKTLDELCFILQCPVSAVLEYCEEISDE